MFLCIEWLEKNSGIYHTEEKRKIQALTIKSTNPQDPEAVGEEQVVTQASSCQAQYYISCFCLLHFQPKLRICEKQIRIKLLQWEQVSAAVLTNVFVSDLVSQDLITKAFKCISELDQ